MRPQPRSTAVLTMLPGELDPKLALAATAELRGAHDEAARYYETVWRTNHSFYSAAFGLARLASASGRPCRRHRHARPDHHRLSAFHRGRHRRDRDSPRRPDRRQPRRTDAARCGQARVDADAGVGDQASDDPAEGARRRAGLARGGKHAEDRAALRCRLRPSPASGSEWSSATARWRTRRPTCGRASTLVEKANAIRPRTRL